MASWLQAPSGLDRAGVDNHSGDLNTENTEGSEDKAFVPFPLVPPPCPLRPLCSNPDCGSGPAGPGLERRRKIHREQDAPEAEQVVPRQLLLQHEGREGHELAEFSILDSRFSIGAKPEPLTDANGTLMSRSDQTERSCLQPVRKIGPNPV